MRAELWFRVMFSGIFVVAGLQHLLRAEAVKAHLLGSPGGALLASVLPVEPLLAAAGVVLLAGGLALLSGFRTQAAAVVLALVLVPITVVVQIGPETLGPLFKNIALLGGLVHFAAVAPSARGASV